MAFDSFDNSKFTDSRDSSFQNGGSSLSERLYSEAGLLEANLAESTRISPWSMDSGSDSSADQSGRGQFDSSAFGRTAESDIVRKVQDFTREKLDAVLNVSQHEKKLVEGLQDSIISGDMQSFRKTLKQLYDGLAIQGLPPERRTEQVRSNLEVVSRILKQYCGPDINIDVTDDDKVIIRLRPDNLAMEIGKESNKVRKVIEESNSVSLDTSKEVIRPSTAEFARMLSDRCTQTRQW